MIFVTLIGVGIAGVVAADEERAEKRTAVVTDTAPIQITSDDLHRAYKANEVNADNLYNGRVLRVTGAVQAIKKNFVDDAYVQLWTTEQFESAHAKFTDDSNLGRLSIGDHIAVRCRGNGMILGSPMLKDCVLE